MCAGARVTCGMVRQTCLNPLRAAGDWTCPILPQLMGSLHRLKKHTTRACSPRQRAFFRAFEGMAIDKPYLARKRARDRARIARGGRSRGHGPLSPRKGSRIPPSNSDQDCPHFSGILPGLHRLWTIFSSGGECCIFRLPILFLPLQSFFSSLHPPSSPQSRPHFLT